ncbi:MAG: hypothetical protein GWN87_26555, partial [Desulfuromonadales bacterium]|nr:hypothetical protein [Desulfuromonadales bacterium]NIS43306.1 hypothetical protein [Desulfuromonadales bacterium]
VHFNQDTAADLLTGARGGKPEYEAPLAEALYEAVRYYRQQDPAFGTDFTNDNGDDAPQNCASGSNASPNKDPYCFTD